MLVDATGSIEITSIKDTHGREVEGCAKENFRQKLVNGDYVLALSSNKIHNLDDGFAVVATIEWTTNNMEYDFDFWVEEEEEF